MIFSSNYKCSKIPIFSVKLFIFEHWTQSSCKKYSSRENKPFSIENVDLRRDVQYYMRNYVGEYIKNKVRNHVGNYIENNLGNWDRKRRNFSRSFLTSFSKPLFYIYKSNIYELELHM